MPGSAAEQGDEETLGRLADGFQALADATRLRIIHLLMTRGETCVCQLMPLLGLTQSNISFHLRTLRYAGFINARKDGKWTHYSLNHKGLEQFHAECMNVFQRSMWPEQADSALRENAGCRQTECL